MDSWFYDGVTAKLVNKGSLGGTVQLGDGVTPATFPTQVFPHGMSWDGAARYLYRASEAALSFATGAGDELPFSLESFFVVNDTSQRVAWSKGQYGTTCEYLSYAGGPIAGMLVVDAGNAAYIGRRATLSTGFFVLGVHHLVGAYDGTRTAAGISIYVDGVRRDNGNDNAGVYTRMGALGGPVRVGHNAGAANYWSGKIFNSAIYPFALQPGEVAQLYQQRRSMIQRGF